MLRHAFPLLLALALGLAPSLASAEVFRWVDELGVTHYTTDRDTIPRRFRGDAHAIEASPAPLAVPSARPAPGEATPALPSVPVPSAEVPSAVVPSVPVPSTEVPSAPVPSAAVPSAAVPSVPAPTEELPSATPTSVPVPSAEVPSASGTPTPELAPSSPLVFPGPPTTPSISPDDPRAAEVAELEARIAADREYLRQMISTKRWDSAELASDPSIREIAERLPRLQAELAALRAETSP